MGYRPKPVTQRDGSPLASSNCLMAVAATGLDGHTTGTKTSTGAKMRALSGDQAGGTNSDEIARAWRKGYQEDAVIKDGRPWSEVIQTLEDGHGVMLQVWHATVGGPCLSGSGQYGHGLYVQPESRPSPSGGPRQWLVADPWCKPPKWVWVSEQLLRNGAHEWAERFASMTTGVLWAITDAYYLEEEDMAIQAPASLSSDYVLVLPKGTAYYLDASLTERISSTSSEYTLPYVGAVHGGKARAVVLTTGAKGAYGEGVKKPTVVYVAKATGSPVRVINPAGGDQP